MDERTGVAVLPRLVDRVADVLSHRLTVVIAGAGYGKTSLLRAWAAETNAAQVTITEEAHALTSVVQQLVAALRLRVPQFPPEVISALGSAAGPDGDADEPARARTCAGILSAALEEALTRDLVLTIDDVDALDEGSPAMALLEALCRQAPPRLHLAVASRSRLPFPIERMRGQGQLLELSAADLALATSDVAALARGSGVDLDPTLVAELRDVTGGSPAAVTIVLSRLARLAPTDHARVIESISEPGGPLGAYVVEEMLDMQGTEVRRQLGAAAALPRFSFDLCANLGLDELAAELVDLERQGIVVEAGDTPGWFTPSPLVAAFLEPGTPEDQACIRSDAAVWLARTGTPAEALDIVRSSGDHEALAALLVEHASRLAATGGADRVVEAFAALPTEDRNEQLWRLEGEARQARGDWDGALACYRRAAGTDELDPGLAWRMGIVHHMRGELDEAFRIYRRGRRDEPGKDTAMLLAYTASAHWLRGEEKDCRELANDALVNATDAADDEALAAAHTVLAMVAALDGDRATNDAHYLRALDHAERARDSMQIIRIRANRGSRFNEEGYYADAIAELDIAIRLSDLVGFATLRALALSNRGEASMQLGQLDDARRDLDDARRLCQQLESRLLAYPLKHLGTLYRHRGDLALARSAYEEAVALAEPAEDLQGLVPALAGLAQTLAETEPEVAEELAARAVSLGPVLGHAEALLAAGWVAYHRGDAGGAADWAREAGAVSSRRRDRASLAESLELQAISAEPAALDLLEEADGIWRDLDNPLGVARTELRRAEHSSAQTGALLARRAGRALRQLGARRLAAQAAELEAELDNRPRASIEIVTLGGFGVSLRGQQVPVAEWQSKKARDLLKILVARRGAVVSRERIIDTLWPDGPAEAGRRLSVTISTLRAVLDPDKAQEGDHFVGSDGDAVWLQREHMAIDVDDFLDDVARATKLADEGHEDEANELLASAEASYRGDFLEEDLYEDWAAGLRAEARSAYVRAARRLAQGASRRGEPAEATRYWLRVLERDPYDERAHLGLVESLVADRRHGEARRAYRTYAERMVELDVEAAPFPTDGAPATVT